MLSESISQTMCDMGTQTECPSVTLSFMYDYFMNLILKKKKSFERTEKNVYFTKICSVLIKYLKNLHAFSSSLSKALSSSSPGIYPV